MALFNTTSHKEFEEKVLKSNKVVLVDFWAGWCGPCVAMTPHLEAIARELDETVDVVKVNIDQRPENEQNMQLAGQYQVQSIPNMPIFVGGKEVDRLIGMMPKQDLAEHLRRHTA